MKQLRNEVIEYIHREDEKTLLQSLDVICCTAFNITLSELDSLISKMDEDTLEVWSKLFLDKTTFAEKKRLLKFRNKHLNYFYEQSI